MSRDFQTVVDVVCVGVRLSRSAVEAAELAVGVTDICRIEMAVDVEVCRAAVSSPSCRVGQFTQCGEIVRGVKRDAVIERQPFAVRDYLLNQLQFFVM